jgi:hypothetical protein
MDKMYDSAAKTGRCRRTVRFHLSLYDMRAIWETILSLTRLILPKNCQFSPFPAKRGKLLQSYNDSGMFREMQSWDLCVC